jgi:hypothetical protein
LIRLFSTPDSTAGSGVAEGGGVAVGVPGVGDGLGVAVAVGLAGVVGLAADVAVLSTRGVGVAVINISVEL